MAVTTGTITSVDTIIPDNRETGLQVARVLFTISGTYAQANNSQIQAVTTAIQNSRRNGKTVTLVDAMVCQPALTTDGYILGAKTLAISTADITFELTISASLNTLDMSTEYGDATAIKAQGTPMGFLVSFTEA